MVTRIAFSSTVVGSGPRCHLMVYAGASTHVAIELTNVMG